MFATAAGQIVRCEIDARVGGTFTIVDRRNGDDIAHTGAYVALERLRRIVFTLSVEKYSKDTDTVTIEITRLGKGCEVTLTQETKAKYAPFEDRARRLDRHSRRGRGAPRGRGADVWHRVRAARDDPREDRRDVRGPHRWGLLFS